MINFILNLVKFLSLPACVWKWLQLIGGWSSVVAAIDKAASGSKTTNTKRRQLAIAALQTQVYASCSLHIPDSIAGLLIEWAIVKAKGNRAICPTPEPIQTATVESRNTR
jgi:hypothetical protein